MISNTISLYFTSIKISNHEEYGTNKGLFYSGEKISATEYTHCNSICPAACTKWLVVDVDVWENDSTAAVVCTGIGSRSHY